MQTIEMRPPVILPPDTEQTLDLLRALSRQHTTGPLVTTLYLRLDTEARIRNRYRIASGDALRRARESVEISSLSRADRTALQRDLARIEVFLEDTIHLPHSPGLVLFACEALNLFQVVPLPRVLATRLLMGERPRVAEAFAAIESFGRIVVALLDRAHARLFEVTAFEVRELSGLALPVTRGGKFHSDRADSPGWGEKDFHHRIKEERHRHAAVVNQVLSRLAAIQPFQGIVLAGAARTVSEQQAFLSRALAGKVIGTVKLNPTATSPAEVRATVLEIRAAWERSRGSVVLASIDEGVAMGWAVNGVEDTLRALSRGQVRVLVVPAGHATPGFRCAESGRLTVKGTECRGEGEPTSVPDLISEAVEDAFEQHIEVDVIDDPGLCARVEGLAALLRFR